MVKAFRIKCPNCGAIINQGAFPRRIYVCPKCKKPIYEGEEIRVFD